MINGSLKMSFHYEFPRIKNASTMEENDDTMPPFSRCDFAPSRLPPQILTLFAVVYLVIIATALLGNLLVIAVIARDRKMRTVTNVLLVSLAVSDAFIAGLNMPFQLKFLMQNEWTMGEALCKFINYIQGVVVVTSIFTLNGIAIDRYYAICRPLQARHLHTIGRALALVFCFWLVAGVVLVPQLLVQRLEPFLTFDGPNATLTTVQMCVEYFPDHRLNVAYTVFFYVFLCVLPALVVFVAYGRIGVTLWYRSPMVESPAGRRVDAARRRTAEKQRVVRMLIVVVVFFAVSWFPFFTAQVCLLFEEQQGDCQLRFWYRSVAAVLHLLAYSNSCVNPVVYCLLNDSFKQSLRRAFGKACSARRCMGWRGWRVSSGRRATLSDTARTTAGLLSASNRRGSYLTGGFTRQLSSPPPPPPLPPSLPPPLPQSPVSAPPAEENQPAEREPFTQWNRAEAGTRRCHGDGVHDDDKSLTSEAKASDRDRAICARPNDEMQESNSVEQLHRWILENDEELANHSSTSSPVEASVPSDLDINDALDAEMTTTDDASCIIVPDTSTSDSSCMMLQPKSLVPTRNPEASSSTGPKNTPGIRDDNKRPSETYSVRDEDGGSSEHRSELEPINGTEEDVENHKIRKIHDDENNSKIELDCQTLDAILSHLLTDAGVQD